jgi:ankyrin repeat protein
MKLKILPPEKAKKKAQIKLAKWKRKKEIDEAKVRGGIATRNTPIVPQKEPDQPTEPMRRKVTKVSPILSQKDKEALNNYLLRFALEGRTAVIEVLIMKGADINAGDKCNCTALKLAAGKGHTEIVELLLKAGADVNATDNFGNTAIIYASANGKTETVQLLIEKRADIQARSNSGKTALTLAYFHGHTETVELLKAHGAKE